MAFCEYLERRLLTLQRACRSYNFACLGYLDAVESFERRNVMTEPNNRVLTRTGARIVTEAEMAQIGGAFSTSMIITDLITNFGQDFSVDHLEN